MFQALVGATTWLRNRLVMSSLARKHRGALCGLELRQPGEDQWAVILPDPSNQRGSFKVQPLDRYGLGTHVGGYLTPEMALRAAVVAGYLEATPGIVETLAASPAWRARYRIDATPNPPLGPVASAPPSVLPGESSALPTSQKTASIVPPDQRHHLIAEAAYFRAAQRGFHGGCPTQDWLEAEREINRRYFQPVQSPREALVFL
jgi:hypothetical protein